MLDRHVGQHRDRFVDELRDLCAIPSEATAAGMDLLQADLRLSSLAETGLEDVLARLARTRT